MRVKDINTTDFVLQRTINVHKFLLLLLEMLY